MNNCVDVCRGVCGIIEWKCKLVSNCMSDGGSARSESATVPAVSVVVFTLSPVSRLPVL